MASNEELGKELKASEAELKRIWNDVPAISYPIRYI